MDNEIVFAVIPHIVRRIDLNEFNVRTIDVGTANSVHLRHAPETVTSQSGKATEAVPGAKAPAETNVALELDPSAISVAEGGTFTVDVRLSGAQNVHSVPLTVAYDQHGLQLLNVSNGNLLSQGEQVVALVHREDTLHSTVEITASCPADAAGVSDQGVVTTLTFQAKAAGRFPIRITKAAVVRPDGQVTATSGNETTVSVQ